MALELKCPNCNRIFHTETLRCKECNHNEWEPYEHIEKYLICGYCKTVRFENIYCPCGEMLLPKRHQLDPTNSSNNGGCFITEACCRSMGNPDDCYELQTFRNFRDKWLKKESDGAALIDEYYSIAPKIVESINSKENSSDIYLNIWNTYLSVCLHDIEKQDYKSCKERYISMVEELKSQYL